MFSSGYLMFGVLFAAASLTAEQPPSGEGVPVSILVTVEGHKNSAPQGVTRQDALVYQNGRRVDVTEWTPASSARGGLQVWVLIDAGKRYRVGNGAYQP